MFFVFWCIVMMDVELGQKSRLPTAVPNGVVKISIKRDSLFFSSLLLL